MTRVKPGQRKRQKTDRSQSGCVTCKARHTRCDEAKPSCLKCTSTGRICDGYPFANGTATLVVNLVQATKWRHLVCRPSSGLGWMSSEEHRSFEYYQLKTLPQFSTIFEDSFWSQTIPQMAHSEASIQHALAALSSFHETSFAGVLRSLPDDCTRRNALKQYNQAIRELSGKSANTVPIEIQLTSCLIFVNIEALRGHLGSAIKLLDYGCRLLRECFDDAGNVLPTFSQQQTSLLCTLLTSFVRLDLQVNLLLARPTQLPLSWHMNGHQSETTAAGPFESFAEARAQLERMAFFYTQIPSTSYTERQARVADLDTWSSALSILVQQKSSHLSASDLRAIGLLKLLVSYINLGIRAPTLPIAGANDALIKTSEMRKLYSDIVEFAFVAVSHCQTEPTYVPDLAVVPPLFSVIQNCDDDAIRKRAYGLLSSMNRQEGLWNSRLTARVAERYMRLIESDNSNVLQGSDVRGAQWATKPLAVNVSIHEEDKQAVVSYQNDVVVFVEDVVW